MDLMTEITTDVIRCARCGGDHKDVKFKKLTRPHNDYTFWAPCPYLGEPILLRIQVEDK